MMGALTSVDEFGECTGASTRLGQAVVIQGIIDEFAVATGFHQLRLPQDAQVLGCDGLLDLERVKNFVHAGFGSRFSVHDGDHAQAERVCQRTHDAG